MALPIAPEPEEVEAQIEPLTTFLWDAVGTACLDAVHYFDAQNKGVDPWLFPSIVRYQVKERLKAAPFSADAVVWDLANNGLQVSYHGYEVRILKSEPDGGLPAAGPSEVRQDFYQQHIPFTDEAAEAIRNVVLLWHTNADRSLRELILVCPKGASEDEVHWQKTLQPLQIAEPVAAVPVPVEADLDIELDVPAASATGTDGGE